MKLRIGNNSGFTLMELLVVIALTVVVMGLVFVPLTHTFNFTRRGEAQIQAQRDARNVAPILKRDLGEAVFIYDNTRDQDRINIYVRKKDGTATVVLVPYAKVDMVLPRMRAFCTASDSVHNANGVKPREYDRGDDAVPTCPADGTEMELRPVQPITPDKKIVRWFIGLSDPTKMDSAKPDMPSYANRFMHLGTGTNNMYVLYRAEFSPYDEKDSSGQPVNRLFPTGRSLSGNLSDPDFFYNRNKNGLKTPDGKYDDTYAKAWRRVARPMVTITNTDLIRLEFDNAGEPIVTPMVSFGPTPVYNDPLVATTDAGDKPEQGNAPPTVYRAKYGQWIGNYEITLRREADNHQLTIYKTGIFQDANNNRSYMGIYKTTDPNKLIFDMDLYQETAKGPSSLDPSWIGYKYKMGKVSPALPELAFTCDVDRGLVNFAFPHVDVQLSEGLPSLLGSTAVSMVVPTTAINQYYSAAETAGQLEDRYRVWELHHPAARTLPLTNYQFSADCMLGNSTVAPGLERVIGPNSNLGDNYGNPTLYTRVPFWNPTAEPSLNQYKLDVDHPVRDNSGNLLNNMDGTAAMYFFSGQTETGDGIPLPDQDSIMNVRGETGVANTISNLYVLFYEQNNKQRDMLWANYVTKSKMTVTLNIRAYDTSTGQPQSTQLAYEMSLRNISH